MKSKTKPREEFSGHAQRGKEWSDVIKDWIFDHLKAFTSLLVAETGKEIKNRLRDFLSMVNKAFISSLMVFLGVVFLMVGMALILNELFNISGGLGFILVGILSVFLGVVVREELKQQK
jgi:hypothetical protein